MWLFSIIWFWWNICEVPGELTCDIDVEPKFSLAVQATAESHRDQNSSLVT